MSEEIRSEDRLLNTRQLAHLIGFQESSIRKLVFQRRIPFLRLGRTIRFRPSEIQKWLDKQRVKPLNRGGTNDT